MSGRVEFMFPVIAPTWVFLWVMDMDYLSCCEVPWGYWSLMAAMAFSSLVDLQEEEGGRCSQEMAHLQSLTENLSWCWYLGIARHIWKTMKLLIIHVKLSLAPYTAHCHRNNSYEYGKQTTMYNAYQRTIIVGKSFYPKLLMWGAYMYLLLTLYWVKVSIKLLWSDSSSCW